MNRTDLVEALSQRSGLSAPVVRQLVDLLFGTGVRPGLIAETLRAGDCVQLPGFGAFRPRRLSARAGVHPRSGERILIPARVQAQFRPAAALKTLPGSAER
ncbi:MAG: HU family DNA-binding protein [Candidatus Latescibacterota bacterium]|nr:MAG: HU family DNA-binding protein [Candidatus Latescibacterota bacterium]